MDNEVSKDVRELGRRLQDFGTLIERLRFEVESGAKNLDRMMVEFYKFVMDPEDGLVVQHRHLERNVQAVNDGMDIIINERLAERLKALEDARASQQDRRKWLMRDLVGVGLMLVVTSLLGAALAAWFLK